MKTSPLKLDVISIQSQVVYGCVGNSIAVPTFRSMGMQVAGVPTVLLSNNPKYPSMHGGVIPDDWFSGILDDLIARGVIPQLKAVQLGYLGGPSQVPILQDWLDRVQEINPGVSVYIDPVLGDSDVGLYTDPRMVQGWRSLLSTASGLTPNTFELGMLTDTDPLRTLEAAVDAARQLLTGRTTFVVATSVAPDDWEPGELRTAIITRDDVELLRFPWVDCGARGTGDMFSAVVTSSLLQGQDLATACERAAQYVREALERTKAAGSEEMVLR